MKRYLIILILSVVAHLPAQAQIELIGGVGVGSDFSYRLPGETFAPALIAKLGLAKRVERLTYGVRLRYTDDGSRIKCIYFPAPGEVIPGYMNTAAGVTLYDYERCSHEAKMSDQYVNLLVGVGYEFLKKDKYGLMGSFYIGPEYKVKQQLDYTSLMDGRTSSTSLRVSTSYYGVASAPGGSRN